MMSPVALLASGYRTSRTAFARASVPLISAGGGWETCPEEPCVLYEGGTWKMWYCAGWASAAMGYATCSGDPTVPGNWTKSGSNPVLGQGGSGYAGAVTGVNVVHVGSTYYCYFYAIGGSTPLRVATSSDGVTWNTPTIAIAANAVGWMTGWANTYVWNEGGSTWKMLVEGMSTGGAWVTNYATSTDGLAWTVQGAGPVTTLAVSGQTNYGGPWLAAGGAKVNGRYELWYHAGTGNYSDIYHAYSTDAQTWTQTGLEFVHNGGTYELQQAADACVVEVAGKTYLFYDGVDNGTPASYINVAVLPMTVAEYCRWIG